MNTFTRLDTGNVRDIEMFNWAKVCIFTDGGNHERCSSSKLNAVPVVGLYLSHGGPFMTTIITTIAPSFVCPLPCFRIYVEGSAKYKCEEHGFLIVSEMPCRSVHATSVFYADSNWENPRQGHVSANGYLKQ